MGLPISYPTHPVEVPFFRLRNIFLGCLPGHETFRKPVCQAMKRPPYQENILAYLRMGATKYIQIPRKELWSGMNIKQDKTLLRLF